MNGPLMWLERYGRQIVFQQFSGSRIRAKNRVLLQYCDEHGNLDACGAPTLLSAITKAQLRNRLARAANTKPSSEKGE